MKNLRHSLTLAASVVIIAITLALSNTTSRVHADDSDGSQVEGTWKVTVTPVGGTPFRALATFSSGGTMVESSSGGGDDKGGQGVWKKTGGRTFAFTFEQSRKTLLEISWARSKGARSMSWTIPRMPTQV